MTEEKIKKMIELGGRDWEKNDFHRIYFNFDVLADLIGLEINRYNTGNISYASMKGEKISTSEAYRIINKIGDKFYYDIILDRWMTNGDKNFASELKNLILSKIGE